MGDTYIGNSYLNTTLKSLKGIENIQNLESLEIMQATQLSNILNLDECSNLKEIIFIGNTSIKSSEYSVLNNKPLENVQIENSNLKDLNFLNTSNNVKTLKVKNNSIENVYPLINCQQLECCDLTNNCISDLSYYSEGENLRPFYTLTVFADLNQTYKLKELYLAGNVIEDFSMLNDSNLEWNMENPDWKEDENE